ncbi:MAG: SpoIID/LytB domain-containing protein [Peptoniphilaceae bacterium]
MKKLALFLFVFICFISKNNVFASENQIYLDVKIGKTYSEDESVDIKSSSNIYLVDADFNKILNLNTNKVTAKLMSNELILRDGEKIFSKNFSTNGDLLLKSDNFLEVGNEYRGYIHFKKIDNKLYVINKVEMEDYLKGVLPKEILSNAPEEALKSQAIVSRSFAFSNINKYKKYGYNLDDTTNCQVYKGKSAEEQSTNKAVDETNNIYIRYNGEVANAIFGSSSGGFTASVEDVWGGNEIPYLKSFEDPYSNAKKWEFAISLKDLEKKLKNNGLELGNIVGIKIKVFDKSKRAKVIEVITNKNVLELSGNKIRSILGSSNLKSTLMTIIITDGNIIFSGTGYGHGVGMSQDGAVQMAKEGKSCRDILSFYFPNTSIDK